jgi:hypothetical protein
MFRVLFSIVVPRPPSPSPFFTPPGDIRDTSTPSVAKNLMGSLAVEPLDTGNSATFLTVEYSAVAGVSPSCFNQPPTFGNRKPDPPDTVSAELNEIELN